MPGREPVSDNIGALFLLGLALFFPPLLNVFDAGADITVFGIPLLFFYLFFAWAVLIGLMACVIEWPARVGERPAIPKRETPPETK